MSTFAKRSPWSVIQHLSAVSLGDIFHFTVLFYGVDTVQRAIAYCFSSMRNQAKRASSRYTVRFDVQKHAVSWYVLFVSKPGTALTSGRLGNHAFYFIFGRYSHTYASLLTSLEWELSRPRYRKYSKRFRSLVKEGQCGLAEIRSWLVVREWPVQPGSL